MSVRDCVDLLKGIEWLKVVCGDRLSALQRESEVVTQGRIVGAVHSSTGSLLLADGVGRVGTRCSKSQCKVGRSEFLVDLVDEDCRRTYM